jgi:hypothetical protein
MRKKLTSLFLLLPVLAFSQKQKAPVVTGTVLGAYGPLKSAKVYYSSPAGHFSPKRFITTDSNGHYTFRISETPYKDQGSGDIQFVEDIKDSSSGCNTHINITALNHLPAYASNRKQIAHDLLLYYYCEATIDHGPTEAYEIKAPGIYTAKLADTLYQLTLKSSLFTFEEVITYPSGERIRHRGSWQIREKADSIQLYYQYIFDDQLNTQLSRFRHASLQLEDKGDKYILRNKSFIYTRK